MTKSEQTSAKPKRPVRETPLDGASSWRSFRGATKTVPRKSKTSSRRVAPDKGELSPR